MSKQIIVMSGRAINKTADEKRYSAYLFFSINKEGKKLHELMTYSEYLNSAEYKKELQAERLMHK